MDSNHDDTFGRQNWLTTFSWSLFPGLLFLLTVLGVLLWVAVSAALRVYLHFFDTYSATYGSLGAVIILMLWFYLTALALLNGAETNAAVEHATAEHGRADAKLKGEKEAPAA